MMFSFVYGGRHSSEFLHDWKRESWNDVIDGQLCHTVTCTDPGTSLAVHIVAVYYLDDRAVDWTLYFTNGSDEDTPILEQVYAVDTITPTRGDVTLHRLRGSYYATDDWLPFDQAVRSGEMLSFAPLLGRSSNGASPFFNVSWSDGGVITAIGWSGQWRAFVKNTVGRVRIQAGMEHIHLSLRPGEVVRSPRILQLYWEGELCDSYNSFRRLMLNHIVPKVNGQTVVPPIAHLSAACYIDNEITEEYTLSHLDSAVELGFEVFWLDAFYTEGGFPNGVGNCSLSPNHAVSSTRFPRGLKPIGDAAQEAGMEFMIWTEPERVAPDTRLAKEYPEWVISLEGEKYGLLNIGLPGAREYVTEYLVATVREYGLGWLRFDFNIDPLLFWRSLDDPDRVGMTEIRYIEGLYRMWGDVRAACPGLRLDNCASGGRRIDLETCSRSLPLWRTDTTGNLCRDGKYEQSALQNQVMTAGLGRYVPFSTSGQDGATPYLFRSGFNGGISFRDDCRGDYPLDLLKAGIEEGKRIRKYFFGNFYPLTEVTTDPTDWCVLQYHRPDEQDGIVLAFRRHGSHDFDTVKTCPLHEIGPENTYKTTWFYDYERTESHTVSGKRLRWLTINIDDRPGSVLVEYRKIDDVS